MRVQRSTYIKHTAETFFTKRVNNRRFLNALEPKGGRVSFVVDTSMTIYDEDFWFFTQSTLQCLVIEVTFENLIIFFVYLEFVNHFFEHFFRIKSHFPL